MQPKQLEMYISKIRYFAIITTRPELSLKIRYFTAEFTKIKILICQFIPQISPSQRQEPAFPPQSAPEVQPGVNTIRERCLFARPREIRRRIGDSEGIEASRCGGNLCRGDDPRIRIVDDEDSKLEQKKPQFFCLS